MLRVPIKYTDRKYLVINEPDKFLIEIFCGERANRLGELILSDKPRDCRSLKQNAFFHGPLLDAFVRCTGEYDKEYIKYCLKDKFLRVYKTDEKYYVKGTSDLKVDEMTFFIDQCIQILVEYGGELKVEEYKEYKEIK